MPVPVALASMSCKPVPAMLNAVAPRLLPRAAGAARPHANSAPLRLRPAPRLSVVSAAMAGSAMAPEPAQDTPPFHGWVEACWKLMQDAIQLVQVRYSQTVNQTIFIIHPRGDISQNSVPKLQSGRLNCQNDLLTFRFFFFYRGLWSLSNASASLRQQFKRRRSNPSPRHPPFPPRTHPMPAP